jgi:hypothetical protein
MFGREKCSRLTVILELYFQFANSSITNLMLFNRFQIDQDFVFSEAVDSGFCPIIGFSSRTQMLRNLTGLP